MKVSELESSKIYVSKYGHIYKLVDNTLMWAHPDRLDKLKESTLTYNEVVRMEFSEYPVDIEPTDADKGKVVLVNDGYDKDWYKRVFIAKLDGLFFCKAENSKHLSVGWEKAKLK